jgi:uncharacterized protein (TIGR03437 family)
MPMLLFRYSQSKLILAGCALWVGLQVPVNQPRTLAPANPLPDLRGQAVVEHLKQEGLYTSLAEAMAAARYSSNTLPSGDAYQFSNPGQDLRATFTSSVARVVSSNGGRDRELTFKLIGYGYGSRMTGLDSRNIVSRQNRIEHEYASQSAIPESQYAIKEWFVNSEAGIEHGFTLPEPPPIERGGDSDGARNDFFGASIAIIVNTVVVGTPGGGSAYVFMTPFAPGAFETVSAASYTSPVAAKEIVAGFGLNLANGTAFGTDIDPNMPGVQLPTTLAGANVVVRDSTGTERPAPLFFASPRQINYQIPADTALDNATVSVFIGPVLVAVGSVQIVTTAPSIFTLSANGSGPAAALDAINNLPAPFNATQAGGSPNIIAVFGTGLGADATDGGDNISASVQALIGGNPVTVTYAGQAPFLVGVNQFNILFPAGITSGEHRLTISRSGVTSNPVTIAIRQ